MVAASLATTRSPGWISSINAGRGKCRIWLLGSTTITFARGERWTGAVAAIILSIPPWFYFELCGPVSARSEEHTSELQSRLHLVCRLLLEKKKNTLLTPL